MPRLTAIACLSLLVAGSPAAARAARAPGPRARPPPEPRRARSSSCSGTATTDVRAHRAQGSWWPSSTDHPAIHVAARYAGGNDNALQKVLAAIAGGKSPDIAYLYGSGRRTSPRARSW